jgi:hypothetical protein
MKRAILAVESLYPQARARDRNSKNLALAILIQAFRDVVSPVRSSREWRFWEQDALQWFAALEDHPGSFQWICGILDLNSSELRRWLDSYRHSGTGRRRKMARKLIRFRFRGE